jgi:hypothetical protein
LEYQVLDYCDFFSDDEACRPVLQCEQYNIVNLEDGNQLNFDPSFRPSVGASFDQWKAAVENDPQLALCALAPVRTKRQLDYYSSIVPPSPTLLGVVMADPVDAYDCEWAHDRKNPEQFAPKQCFEGWINIVDGSHVPEKRNLWAEGIENTALPRPNGGIYANLFVGGERSPGMYDECNPYTTHGGSVYRGGNLNQLPMQQCNLFANALVECCTNPTCYGSALAHEEEHHGKGSKKGGHHHAII